MKGEQRGRQPSLEICLEAIPQQSIAGGDPLGFMPQKLTSLNNLCSRIYFFSRDSVAADNKVHGSQAENWKGNQGGTGIEKKKIRSNFFSPDFEGTN